MGQNFDDDLLKKKLKGWTDGWATLLEMDLRHATSHVRVPALVVVGDIDRLTPPASALALKRSLPDARMVVLKGAGHMAPLERHEQFNELLEGFLDEAFSRSPVAAASSTDTSRP